MSSRMLAENRGIAIVALRLMKILEKTTTIHNFKNFQPSGRADSSPRLVCNCVEHIHVVIPTGICEAQLRLCVIR